MGIFAQSTRTQEINEREAKGGVAMFAIKTGVPIIPVGIKASYKLFSNIVINIGKPIYFNDYVGDRLRKPEINRLTENVMLEVKKLIE